MRPRTTAEFLRKNPGLGLGDAVAFVAKPIARVSDAVLKTNLAQCPACAQRQRNWNRIRLG